MSTDPTMTSGPTATTTTPAASPPIVVGARPVRWPVAAIGGVIAALGLSGLVDDSGLIEHPWWVALIIAGVIAALGMIGHTVRSLAAAKPMH